MIDKRAHMIVFVQRVADLYLPIGANQFLFKAIVHTFVDDKPPGAGATLAGSTHGSKYRADKRHIKVGIFADDDRIVPAKLQQAFAEPRATRGPDCLAHAG